MRYFLDKTSAAVAAGFDLLWGIIRSFALPLAAVLLLNRVRSDAGFSADVDFILIGYFFLLAGGNYLFFNFVFFGSIFIGRGV